MAFAQMLAYASPVCYHAVNGNQCSEACAETAFKMKGFDNSSTCPKEFNVVDNTVVTTQCPDGITNVKYCPDTKLNVTVTTKGMAFVQMVNELAYASPVCY